MKNSSRRSFIAKGSFFSVLGIAGFLPFLHSSKKEKKDMFVHHVFFWLKNPDAAEDKRKLLEGLKSLKDIAAIKSCHIGVPADTDRPVIERGYQYSLLLIFDNVKDQNIYQDHPTHLKFVDNYSSLWSKVIVYDSVNA